MICSFTRHIVQRSFDSSDTMLSVPTSEKKKLSSSQQFFKHFLSKINEFLWNRMIVYCVNNTTLYTNG